MFHNPFLDRFFLRTAKTLCSDCALTISDIGDIKSPNGFFHQTKKRYREENGRATFFDFVTWAAEKSDKVENYRFLENCSMKFAENQQRKSVLNILSLPIMKKFKIGSKNFQFFFDFTCADRKKIYLNNFRTLASSLAPRMPSPIICNSSMTQQLIQGPVPTMAQETI